MSTLTSHGGEGSKSVAQLSSTVFVSPGANGCLVRGEEMLLRTTALHYENSNELVLVKLIGRGWLETVRVGTHRVEFSVLGGKILFWVAHP